MDKALEKHFDRIETRQAHIEKDVADILAEIKRPRLDQTIFALIGAGVGILSLLTVVDVIIKWIKEV